MPRCAFVTGFAVYSCAVTRSSFTPVCNSRRSERYRILRTVATRSTSASPVEKPSLKALVQNEQALEKMSSVTRALAAYRPEGAITYRLLVDRGKNRPGALSTISRDEFDALVITMGEQQEAQDGKLTTKCMAMLGHLQVINTTI